MTPAVCDLSATRVLYLVYLDLDVYYSTPLKGVERVGLVQFLCCENWLLAEILGNSCFKLVVVFNFFDV